MLLPAASSYIRPATLDVESAYSTYHGLRPPHTLDTWSSRALLRLPEPQQVRDDESERRPDEWPPHTPDTWSSRAPEPEQVRGDESERWPDEWPPHTLDTWLSGALLRIPGPEQVRDDENERWPDEWPPNEEPPRIVRFNTPPPPYTELPPASPADRQQVRKKLVKPQPQTAEVSTRKRRFGRLKTNMAAFGHQVKTRWGPAMLREFIVFLGYMAGHDRDGKRLTTLGLN